MQLNFIWNNTSSQLQTVSGQLYKSLFKPLCTQYGANMNIQYRNTFFTSAGIIRSDEREHEFHPTLRMAMMLQHASIVLVYFDYLLYLRSVWVEKSKCNSSDHYHREAPQSENRDTQEKRSFNLSGGLLAGGTICFLVGNMMSAKV